MLILASTSKTRIAMLQNAGLLFSAEAPQIDESELVSRHPEWRPQDVAVKLAEAKACEVSRRHPNAFVIGADQVLALGSIIYSKPADVAQCRQQLMELRGKTHALVSGVAIARNGRSLWIHQDEALLRMRDFSMNFLSSYLDAVGDDCTTSVGGYKIEGPGVQLFDEIRGDHFTILGLPLLALVAWLRQAGEIEL